MAARPILLALVWHMHQPCYAHAASGGSLLPWVRLHATKDYRDMVDLLSAYPGVRCTFNLTPVLLDQLERIAAGERDAALRLAETAPASLTAVERATLLREFFSVHRERMLEPYARYRELLARAEEERAGGSPLTDEECRDLQVWFHLAWVDPSYAGEEPIRSLLAKRAGFSEQEKHSLLAWGTALAGTVAGAYREAAEAGRIELITSAHFHPILPLLIDSGAPREVSADIVLPEPSLIAAEDAAAQLRSARESHARRFGVLPRGTWPPEGAVSAAAVALIREGGFNWAASDESLLARALVVRDGMLHDWPAALYRPYRVDTPSGPLAMVFRDRNLSDRIGFVYQRWDPLEAAADFIEHVRSAGARAGGEGPALVTVILDGENCWEGYEADGRPFLAALYEGLQDDPSIETVTVSEALERMPSQESLPGMPVGSWIRDDLSIWIGHPEKNRAWGAIQAARDLLVSRGAEAPKRAWERLYAAEGSDWFWWYGDDHESRYQETFDLLFRGNLIQVYELLGVEPPRALRFTLRSPSARDPVAYDAVASGGAMHRVTGYIGKVRFGVEGTYLRVSIDPRAGASGAGAALVFQFGANGEAEARLPLDGPSEGDLEWSPTGSASGETGSYARDTAVEVIIPLDRVATGPSVGNEREIGWSVAVERAGSMEERVPDVGFFHAPLPER